MQKFIPGLKIALIVCVVLFAAVIVFSLATGADKPFSMAFPLIMGLVALGMLSVSRLATPNCPTCGEVQPAVRRPTSFRQMLLGGWTCTKCGTEIDRHGRAIGKSTAK
jgi:hypothetical protein